MAISILSSTSGTSSDQNTAVSGTINTTGATLLVVATHGIYGAGIDPVVTATTGSSIGSPTGSIVSTITGSIRAVIFYWEAPATSASHAFTCTALFARPDIAVWALDGTLTSGANDGATNNGSSEASSNTSLQPGSSAPSENDEFLATYFAGQNLTQVLSINESFNLDFQAVADSNHYGFGAAQQIQTTATTRNPTWSNIDASSMTRWAVIAGFKASGGGGGGGKGPLVSGGALMHGSLLRGGRMVH